jgi:hypothetical protein
LTAYCDIRGDLTGRIWLFHPAMDQVAANGERYRATAQDDGSLALLHRCEKTDLWEEELERLKHAIDIARRPEIIAAPTIRQLIDSCDVTTIEHEVAGTIHGALWGIWEWADISLRDFIGNPDQDPPAVADEVETNVGAALEVLHGIGLVHLDVAPNNILRVNGAWKLADLDNCVNRGDIARARPKDDRWVHRDRLAEPPAHARDEFDWYGLKQILAEFRKIPGHA